ALGVAARSAQLVLLFAIGRLFGASALGKFLLGFGLYEVAVGVAITGLTDGTTLFVSRHAAPGAGKGADRLGGGGGTARPVAVGAAVALALLTTAGAAALAGSLSGPYRELLPALPVLAWALVPTAIARVSFAACSGLSRLEWDAIAGGAGPALGMLVLLPAARWWDPGLGGLFASLLVAQIAVAVLALFVLARSLGAA